MGQKFGRLGVRSYTFRESDGKAREVIAVFAGSRRVAFLEYSTARRFVDQVHDLCDDHERSETGTVAGHLSKSGELPEKKKEGKHG